MQHYAEKTKYIISGGYADIYECNVYLVPDNYNKHNLLSLVSSVISPIETDSGNNKMKLMMSYIGTMK